MNEIKLTKELQEIFDKTGKEREICNIILSNDALSDALSAMYYFNRFENNLSNIGIGVLCDTDFGEGLKWLRESIQKELMYEFDMPKEVFETDDYLYIIYGSHLTDGALIVAISQYINWIQENTTQKAD